MIKISLNRKNRIIGELYDSLDKCEIPVPKCSDQGDALDPYLKKLLKSEKIQMLKPLYLENSNF